MVLGTNIKKVETVSADGAVRQPKVKTGRRRNRRRFAPRRSIFLSRLTQLILLSNLVGVIILTAGALTMGRFEDGLIDAKVGNVQSLATTITTVMGERATGISGQAELDIEGAKQVLRGVAVPEGMRVRLFDRSGQVVADTTRLNDTIEVGELDPIITEDTPAEPATKRWRERTQVWFNEQLHDLPWRERRRDALRRDLRLETRAVLDGDEIAGPRYDIDDQLLVIASLPVTRVSQVLGVVTVESNDVASIVAAERRALAPIIGLALLAALLSSFLLVLFITLPMRRLARAAEQVARNPQKYDVIPDLSRRRDEVGDLSLVMRDMTKGLYNRVDDIANFAADVAHEIKNPLTSLRSASDTLRVAKTDEQRAQLIDIIQQDVSRMNRLITDISHASKVDANLAKDTVQILDIGDVIHNIVTFYEQTKTGAAIVRNVSELEAAVFIRAFETPFAQVLRNLIDNALTFSAPEGEVRVGASATEAAVTICVDDDGPGIPAGNLETVFERFYTQRPKGAQFGSHSGLGLAICRQIIAAHKGEIWAENRFDEEENVVGARFIVKLPRQTRGGGPDAPKRRNG